MAIFRSLEEISLNMLDFLRLVQPDLDTKPGQVARDLFVDAPATEISKLYIELRNIANRQSISSATGNELNLLARNFGLVRRSGSPATGTVIFTVNTLESNVFIPADSIVTARNGITYRTLSDAEFDSAKANVYKSNAIRLRSDLDLASISDDYALEVTVEATSFGTTGNVGKFGITVHSIAGISNVTNAQSFAGGANAETDDAFRSRVLGIFAGSNTGTALGYANVLLANSAVTDVVAVEPGNPLMTRDGTDVEVNDDGEKIIISSGTGGKVDLYVQGSQLEEFTESFIYRDQSGRGDATDSSNDFILGQRGVNPLLDFQQKRQLLLKNGTLPFQPAEAVLSVSGSLSGPNFTQKFTDSAGQTQGSFELVSDTGDLGGSPFGLDKIHFISQSIDLSDEAISKGPFNGEDALDFTGVNEVPGAKQLVIITNESPAVDTSDRSIITLKHTPITTINSIVNSTTGQRYTIENTNLEGVAGEENMTGRVKISGGTLPTSNDELKANYIWRKNFDGNIDYDDLTKASPVRTAQDSIDWGFSNKVVAEEQTVLYSVGDGYHVLVTHPVSRVVDVNESTSESVAVVSGTLTVANNITNIVSVKDEFGKEMFYTAKSNGSFSGKVITLPTDYITTSAANFIVKYNQTDLYSPDGYDNGTASGSQVNLPDGVALAGDTVFVDYVANVNNIIPTTSLENLPATGTNNQFTIDSNIEGNQPVSNVYDGYGAISRNLRFAPTHLRINLQGVLSSGRLLINGTGFYKVEQVFQVQRDGLTVDLSTAIKLELGSSTIPSSAYVAMVESVEKVDYSGGLVTGTQYEYDILNYELKNVSYSNGTAFEDSSLTSTEFSMMATEDNTTSRPLTGDYIKVVAYVIDTNFSERLLATTSGIQFSKYKYASVSNISVDSGFLGLSGNIEGTITVNNFNQPLFGTTYFTTYSYTAPKEGERITVTYNYNKLVSDLLYDIEEVRPITADVLVKSAVSIPVDVSLNVVALDNFTGGDENLVQNVSEAISNFLSNNSLGTIVDSSDVIDAAYNVSGVDRVTITKFNESGLTGIKQSIEAEDNSYISSGEIVVTVEER